MKYSLVFAFGIALVALGYALWMYYKLPQYPILVPGCAVVVPFFLSYLGWKYFVEKMRKVSLVSGMVLGTLCGWSILASGFLGLFLDAVLTENTGIQTIHDLASASLFVVAAGPFLLFILWGWTAVFLSLILGTLLVKHRSKSI